MEFNFRAGSNRTTPSAASSSSSFAAHALRVGLVASSETETRMLEPTPLAALTAPIADPMRELREQIRLEVLREMEHKRLMKEEMRREIEMEQAMATRLGWGTDSFSWSVPGGIATRRPETTLSPLVSQARLADKMELLHSWKPRDQGLLPPPAKVESGISNFCTVGSKRKASLSLETSKKVRSSEKWGCALCQVNATSKEALDDHFNGKKHKSRESLLSKGADETSNQVSDENGGVSNVCTVGTKRKASLSLETSKKVPSSEEWGCALCQVSATSKEALDDHFNGKKHKSRESLLSKGAGETSNQVSAENVSRSVFLSKAADETWRCSLCQVTATSKRALDEHLNGKKHKSREVRSGARKEGDGNGDSCLSVQTVTGNALTGKIELKDSASDNNAELIDKEQCNTNLTIVKRNPVKGKAKKKYLLCQLCRVKSNSQCAYSAHLKGKLHKAQLELFNSRLQNDPTKEPVVSVGNLLCGGTAPVIGKADDMTEEGNGENRIKDVMISGGEIEQQ